MKVNSTNKFNPNYDIFIFMISKDKYELKLIEKYLDIKFDKPNNPSLYIKWKKNLTAFKISKKIIKLIEND